MAIPWIGSAGHAEFIAAAAILTDALLRSISLF
ncbi:hypothetical protein M2281_002935 [Mesorhizobium soli]|nr:hypothetical protein [Mesorhizobium soli]